MLLPQIHKINFFHYYHKLMNVLYSSIADGNHRIPLLYIPNKIDLCVERKKLTFKIQKFSLIANLMKRIF